MGLKQLMIQNSCYRTDWLKNTVSLLGAIVICLAHGMQQFVPPNLFFAQLRDKFRGLHSFLISIWFLGINLFKSNSYPSSRLGLLFGPWRPANLPIITVSQQVTLPIWSAIYSQHANRVKQKNTMSLGFNSSSDQTLNMPTILWFYRILLICG